MESAVTTQRHGKIIQTALLGIASALTSISASAVEFGPMFHASLEMGGEDLVTTSEGDVSSGGLFHLGLGVAIHGYTDAGNLETHISLGVKADSVSASNGSVSFYRWPLEVIQYLKSDRFNFGVGLSYHLNPEEECDVDFQCDYVIKYDNALGYVAAVNYIINRETGRIREATIGIRYTVIEYQYADFPWAPAVDGNSFGISVGLAY